VQHGKNNVLKGSTNIADNKNGTAFESKKYAYNNNYKGKNPITKTQWRRFQRPKNGVVVSLEDKTIDPNDDQRMVKPGRRPAKERLSLLLVKDDPGEDDELDSKFMDSEPDFDVICNMVSIFPAEYDMVSEVEDSEEEFDPKDMEEYKLMCFFVTNNGSKEDQKAIFEKPDDSMKNHLKPLFIQARVDEIGIN